MEIKHASFFGGAQKTITPEYHDSVMIGEYLAEKDYIVLNGGYSGLMEGVSKGVMNKNGIVIGYTVKTFGSIKGNKYLSATIVCEDIYERLRCLVDVSSVFIIQKGGIGTLTELMLLLDISRKKSVKPKILVFGNEWKDILTYLSSMIPDEIYSHIHFLDSVVQLEEHL
jgi:uncharacterized protein (TIGR00725 family)